MTLWEYHIMVFKIADEILPTFNRLGSEGWELVSIAPTGGPYIKAIFKRPKGF